MDGIVPEIVPADVEVSVPMDTGLAKLPLLLLNCAVNTLPALNVPLMVNGTPMAAPAQIDVLTALVAILWPPPGGKTVAVAYCSWRGFAVGP